MFNENLFNPSHNSIQNLRKNVEDKNMQGVRWFGVILALFITVAIVVAWSTIAATATITIVHQSTSAFAQTLDSQNKAGGGIL